MIIEIDGYYGRAFLSGKKCSRKQLIRMYRETARLSFDPRDFADVFCRLHRFEHIPPSKFPEIDFVLDTDTGRIYTPWHDSDQ